MNKTKIGKRYNDFLHYLSFYLGMISDIKKIDESDLTIYYKYEISEGIIVKLLADWENFCKNILIDSLHRDSTKYSENIGLKVPKHLPRSVCHGLINGVGFFDVRGYEDLKNLSKKIIVDIYNPFLIDKNKIKNEIGYIEDVYIFRNLIAHSSLKGYISYKKRLSQKYGYSRIHNPGKLLFSKNDSGSLTIEAFIYNFQYITEELIFYSFKKGLLSNEETKLLIQDYNLNISLD